MAHHSSSEMPSISFSLVPKNHAHLRRDITLTRNDDTLLIGRASKTGSRGIDLIAKPYNGLFESPVVTREHAILRMETLADGYVEVHLSDSNSRHGTYVNGRKLAPDITVALEVGDEIQFGVDVTFTEGTVKCVTVTYCEESDRYQPYGSRSSTGHTFSVPVATDDEEDFYDEVLDDIDNEDHLLYGPSPGYTSSESKSGSQQQPIEVPDSASQVDEDQDVEILVADSVPAGTKQLRDAIKKRHIISEPVLEVIDLSIDTEHPAIHSNEENDQRTAERSAVPAQPTSALMASLLDTALRLPHMDVSRPDFYDPVRDLPGATDQAWTAAPLHMANTNNNTTTFEQVDDSHNDLFDPAPLSDSRHAEQNVVEEKDIIQETQSKKRKAYVLELNNDISSTPESLGSPDIMDTSFEVTHHNIPRKIRKIRSSHKSSILREISKYSIGAAVGVTGTFTFLSSPLGGMLTDWIVRL